MIMENVTIKTKGLMDSTSGYARVEGGYHLDKKLIHKIESAAIKQLSDDNRINAEYISPTVTDITIVKPYTGSLYNVRCKVNIGTGWYIDVDLHKFNVEFELRCAHE